MKGVAHGGKRPENRMTIPMPAVFVGHGNPMNALLDNAYTRGWAAIGKDVPLPRAVLSISAHWYIPETSVTAMPAPRTIHDFGGFPPELYRIHYPAPGDPALADRIRGLLAPMNVHRDDEWGLDHGTWTVLRHMFPGAGIPVVQLAIDKRQPAEYHYNVGKRLAPLRDEGVLILGSGNLVHNLLAYETLGDTAALSVPTPDHYLPLLYVIALRREGDPVRFPVEGVDGGSVSMLTVRIG